MPDNVNERPKAPTLQMCSKTVMDGTDRDIQFDADGVCNYFHEYQDVIASRPNKEHLQEILENTVNEIKAAGKNKKYDCILGLSGGVDSSYLAHVVVDLGLRPLVVHFDNGWNTETAVGNINKIVSKLGLTLETFVMDWEEFKDLQRSYFKASVLDLEVPTDLMIFGALYKIANKEGIKTIISGNNIATEWLLPKSWYYSKFDMQNLKSIHKKFGTKKLKKLPAMGFWEMIYYQSLKGIRDVKLLDLIDYNKTEAKKFIAAEFDWEDYGGKHHESIFTRFYQGYILPNKFGIDKRKAHLSNLIMAGEITRQEALIELQQPTYDPTEQKRDKRYVAKKLGFSDAEFEEVLTQPNVSHETYGTDHNIKESYFKLRKALAPVTNPIKKIIRSHG